jgi:hypothetical protein
MMMSDVPPGRYWLVPVRRYKRLAARMGRPSKRIEMFFRATLHQATGYASAREALRVARKAIPLTRA